MNEVDEIQCTLAALALAHLPPGLLQQPLCLAGTQLAMLHLLHQQRRLRAPQQSTNVPQTRSEARSAHAHASSVALRALGVHVAVLRPLPRQRLPLSAATAQVARHDTAPTALPAPRIVSRRRRRGRGGRVLEVVGHRLGRLRCSRGEGKEDDHPARRGDQRRRCGCVRLQFVQCAAIFRLGFVRCVRFCLSVSTTCGANVGRRRPAGRAGESLARER